MLRRSAAAAACAYAPPLPIAAMPFVGLDDVAGPGKQEEMLGIAHDHQRLETAQGAILTPILRQLDGGARKSLYSPNFAFELLQQRDAVGGRTGETGQDLAAGNSCALFGRRA